MAIRDRVVELRRVRASELRGNPRNWRTHPAAQRTALEGAVGELGFATAIIGRIAGDGAIEVIDGHLRADVAGDEEVPVLILDVTAAEADVLLATLDPLSAMAGRNDDALREILAGIEVEDERLRAMLADLDSKPPVAVEEGIEEPPASTYQRQLGVIVVCETEEEQAEVYERLTNEGLTCRVVVT